MSGTLSSPILLNRSVLALTLASTSSDSDALTVMPTLCSSTPVSFSFIAADGSLEDRMVAPCGADWRCRKPTGIHTTLSLVASGLAFIHNAAQCGQAGSKNTYTVLAAIMAPTEKPVARAADSYASR